jgi:hypothetical protein
MVIKYIKLKQAASKASAAPVMAAAPAKDSTAKK